MHVYYPEEVWYEPSNTYYDVSGLRYCEWYANPNKYREVEPEQCSFFREKRRRTYSDVFHAKLLRPGGFSPECVSTQKDRYAFSAGSVFRVPYPDPDSLHVSGADVGGNGTCYLYATASTLWYAQTGGPILLKVKVYTGRFEKFYSRYSVPYMRIRKLAAYGSVKVNTGGTVSNLSSTGDTRELKEAVEAVLSAVAYTVGPKKRWTQDHMRDVVDRLCHGLYGLASSNLGKVMSQGKTKSLSDPITPQPLPALVGEDSFLLHEPGVILDGMDDMLYGKGTQAYFRNVLLQNAFLNLVENVPRLNDNNISNLLEISSFIKSLVIDKKVEVPKSLSDAWLSYRYTYGTSKMDATQAIHFVHRHMDLGDWSHLKTHGNFGIAYDGTYIRCHCVADVLPKQLDTVSRLWKKLYTYGLSPTFYTAWDMIPYSFVVDWFLPIGDIMAAWDAEREMKHFYDIRNVQYSLTYERDTDIGVVRCYSRWLAGPPPELQGRYFLEKNASSRTVVKRIIDGAALIIG